MPTILMMSPISISISISLRTKIHYLAEVWTLWVLSLLVVILCIGVQVQKLASTYGDVRVYDVINDARSKVSAKKKAKTGSAKKKSKLLNTHIEIIIWQTL